MSAPLGGTKQAHAAPGAEASVEALQEVVPQRWRRTGDRDAAARLESMV